MRSLGLGVLGFHRWRAPIQTPKYDNAYYGDKGPEFVEAPGIISNKEQVIRSSSEAPTWELQNGWVYGPRLISQAPFSSLEVRLRGSRA